MDNLPREVINAFIGLTERIANSKTNVLDFGDYPGIFSSEIARRFGITRAVVHKTLLKLEERELVTKTQNDADKKRVPLFLTEKGRQAYQFHEEYHNRHDKALFEYVGSLSQPELEAVKKFLEYANNLIENHA